MKKKIRIPIMPVLLLALVLAAGCKQPTVENRPVAVSGVTLDLSELQLITGVTATLTATVEPENATNKGVSWSAEPEGVVALKADGNSCSVTAEGAGTATVTAKTSDGGKTAQCTVTIVDAYGTISNVAFVEAVGTQCKWTKKSDGTIEMTPENQKAVQAVRELYINGWELSEEEKLTDFSGIEWFSGLTYLSCDGNQLRSLDVSANTALTELHCGNNELTALEVSKNTGLTSLSCSNNKLTTLDVSANRLLEYLDCTGNQLAELDVSKNTGLTSLSCSYNELTELDVSANRLLMTLYCYSNQLGTLDITNQTEMEWLYCGLQTSDGTMEQYLILMLTESQYAIWEGGLASDSTNQWVTVNVVGGTATVTGVTLDRSELNLITGDTAMLTAMVEPENAAYKEVTWSAEPEGVVTLKAEENSCSVTAENTGSATVTVTTADGNKTAQCEVTVYVPNTIINFAFIAAVEQATDSNGTPVNIAWDKNEDGTVSLTDANLEKMRAVTGLNLENKGLTDLSGIEWFTGLTYLSCDDNNLGSLDVSKNTALENLSCHNNQLTALDVSANTGLTSLSCSNNKLTALDVSANRLLEYLDCTGNQLTALDVSGCTALSSLYCLGNQLTALDVSKNTVLVSLSCSYNKLTTLDVSANRLLEYLDCTGNQLTALNVSGCTALSFLSCYNNQLRSLDVSANRLLTWLQCGMQTSDGIIPRDLNLTLNENQKTTWENEWKSSYSNDQNVVLTD